MNQILTKYPRTPHLPWSLGKTSDDKVMSEPLVAENFHGKEVVITEKMDGENTTMYNNHIHARSLDSRHHVSRDWVKSFHATIRSDIPEGWRICGENVYAKHSVGYENLESYFLGFSIWDADNICLPWWSTLEWFDMLGVTPVTELACFKYGENSDNPKLPDLNLETCEGYVMRISDSFHYDEFSRCVAKFVREDHVQTDTHWMSQEVVPNKRKNDN